jgi:hypothetical protein
LKDKDSFASTQYVNIYIRFLPICLIIALMSFFRYGWIAFFIAVLVSFILPLPAMYATGRIADAFVFLYNGGYKPITLNEQLAGDLDRIRHLKQEKKFQEALDVADAVLTRSLEHPEALFLKAQILFEGFTQYSAANACLKKIIAMETLPDESIRQWATTLREEILQHIQKRADRQS